MNELRKMVAGVLATGLAVGMASGGEANKIVVDGSTTVGPIAKAFAEMYPSVHLTPGDIMPSQFKRPYISAGRANQTAAAGQKPRLPMSASTPDAGQFDRR